MAAGPGAADGLNRGYFARPTVFSEVTPEMRYRAGGNLRPVPRHPALPGTRKTRSASPTPRSTGFSSHVQSTDQEAARRVARRIRAGQVHINYPGLVRLRAVRRLQDVGQRARDGKFRAGRVPRDQGDFSETRILPGSRGRAFRPIRRHSRSFRRSCRFTARGAGRRAIWLSGSSTGKKESRGRRRRRARGQRFAGRRAALAVGRNCAVECIPGLAAFDVRLPPPPPPPRAPEKKPAGGAPKSRGATKAPSPLKLPQQSPKPTPAQPSTRHRQPGGERSGGRPPAAARAEAPPRLRHRRSDRAMARGRRASRCISPGDFTASDYRRSGIEGVEAEVVVSMRVRSDGGVEPMPGSPARAGANRSKVGTETWRSSSSGSTSVPRCRQTGGRWMPRDINGRPLGTGAEPMSFA